LINGTYAMNDVKAIHPEDLIDFQAIFIIHNINCYF
ncbi:glycyl-radical enzyme activating protein, partial [Streptococcus suis]